VHQLDACPLCRTLLTEGAKTCPGCGADLSPYYNLEELRTRYLSFARELLSRGELEQARGIFEGITQLISTDDPAWHELATRLALADGDFAVAEELADKCAGQVAKQLHEEINVQRANRIAARELYNYGLTAARSGAFACAAEQLARAVVLEPDDAAIWQLKLKVDLKQQDFTRCYEDLHALDRLTARPVEYHRLEELLPPLVQAKG